MSDRDVYEALLKAQPVGTHFITYQEALRKSGDDTWSYVQSSGWGTCTDEIIVGVMLYLDADRGRTPLDTWSLS